MGFTFDDTDTKGVASPIAEMHRLIAKDPATPSGFSLTSVARKSMTRLITLTIGISSISGR